MSAATLFAPLVDLVFPPRCPACGDQISAQAGLCASCWEDLAIPGNPSCNRCSRPFASTIKDDATCAPCLSDPPEHDGIAAATLYNDMSRKLVLTFKYGNRIALAPMMARLMVSKMDFLDEDWLIIPVPLHRWRIWRRGYNQAGVLSREIAKATGARLCIDGLLRTKATPSLGGLGAKARSRALSGAIAVNPKRRELLAKTRILLVDDVFTSGATSAACVSSLKRNGADRVHISCFARVMDEALDGI